MAQIISVNAKKGELTDSRIKLFHEGKNFESYNFMGSHCVSENRKKGIRFTTWAPNAREIYVVGDFSDFKPIEEFKMEKINEKGIWSLFIKGLGEGVKYKYYIIKKDGQSVYKTDPYGKLSELRPNTASIIKSEIKYRWSDKKWINRREKINILQEPINIYEMHLGSWKQKDGNFITYKELSEELPNYLESMGYTHVEFMPIIEHPLDASWGYQGVGYYSATSRYGNPEDLKELINSLHRKNIGVILDWVPGHFCKDEHGLYMFDGTPTYEYEEGWKAENKGWGTSNFDLGKPEVKSFLISNAIYWLKEFHFDGLRVDAVSNMLYLNYGRKEGEWIPNKYGGDGCLEAIDFLKELNTTIFNEFNNIIMVAEEATSWPNITKRIEDGGLGFNFKWNMGWMNDTLRYVEIDPIYRKNNHNKMNFSMMYNYSENFILPLSHDEVVHGKKSLVDKIWGDYWNKFAGLRVYLGYMMGHPGKKLNFMGYEIAQFIEWREYEELNWSLIEKFDMHKKHLEYCRELNKLYKENKALWELDYDEKGFKWIDADNSEKSIFTFIREGINKNDTLVFICNFTPVVYYDFKVGVPYSGAYKEIFNSDNEKFGGSNQLNNNISVSEEGEVNKMPYSIKIKVPPMAISVYSIKIYEENDEFVESKSIEIV